MPKYTKEKPPVPGWYWMKQRDRGMPNDERISVEHIEIEERVDIGELRLQHCRLPDNAEWSGPIHEPGKSTTEQTIEVPRELLKKILEDEIELYNLSVDKYLGFSGDKLKKLEAEYNKRIDQIHWLLR